MKKYVIEKTSNKSDIITIINEFNNLADAEAFMDWLKDVSINSVSQSYEVYSYTLYSYDENTEHIEYLDNFDTTKIL